MRNEIQNTNYYKSCEKFKKDLLLTKGNLEKVRLGTKMTELKGFDFWVKTTHPSRDIKSIVLELTKPS
jgi:hypothetical protein